METIKWAVNEMPKTDDSQLQVMSLENVAKARAFHESFPQYSVTPLVKLDHMAAYLGLKEVYVKDESYRFGLNAFKVLQLSVQACSLPMQHHVRGYHLLQ